MNHAFTAFTSSFPRRVVESSDAPFRAYADQCANAGVERRYVAKTETIEQLAIESLRKLFDVIRDTQPACTALILSTARQSGDEGFSIPATARRIADEFDIDAAEGINYACSGFSAAVARALELRRDHEHVAVVSAEVASHGLNYDDPATAVLFGDGAGATSISAQGIHAIEAAWVEEMQDDNCALGTVKGEFKDFNGVSRMRTVFRMKPMAVYRTAVKTLTELATPVIQQHIGRRITIVPHQPSRPVLERFEQQLKKVDDRIPVVSDLHETGNLVSASVPVALARNIEDIPQSTLVLCPTVGGGPNLKEGSMSRGMVIFERG